MHFSVIAVPIHAYMHPYVHADTNTDTYIRAHTMHCSSCRQTQTHTHALHHRNKFCIKQKIEHEHVSSKYKISNLFTVYK